jgi:hypothetical protein
VGQGGGGNMNHSLGHARGGCIELVS